MENAIVDLSEALRERLAIIGDEESRRDEASAHGAFAARSRKRSTNWQPHCRVQSIRDLPITSSAAATIKRLNSWNNSSGVGSGAEPLPLGRANVIGRRPVLSFLLERGRRFLLAVIL